MIKASRIKASKSIKISGLLPIYLEISGLIVLAGIVIFFLATSWRKWPDPLIDFGRELYVPWRLAQGAVLYRDVDDFYGPLSQYFNASLITCFGRGLMVLVTANLVVFFGILTAVYVLCRIAWGSGAALVAAAIFASVFGFSQFVGIGNYNYATPYSHETTHGLFVCLLLVLVLLRWLDNPTPGWSLVAGALFGLTAVLKPEIMLAGALVTITAGLASWRYGKSPRLSALVVWICGAALPTLGFIAYFSAFFSWKEAVRAACRGWLNAITSARYSGYSLQMSFLGLDHPWEHSMEQAIATLQASILIAVIAGVAWLTQRMADVRMRVLMIGLLGLTMAWLACDEIVWLETGRCLLGITVIYTVVCAVSLFRKGNPQMRAARLLMVVLAAALIARMVLNGRIYQYGYYQAALAGLLMPAVLIGELPEWLGMVRWGVAAVIVGSLALLVPGVMILASDSQHILSLKTRTVGKGSDQFYAFSPEIDPKGEIVDLISQALQKMPSRQTLLVLPEGVMINYLAGLPSPVAPYCFYSMATADGREDQIVKKLKTHPPDWVVIVSRDLREYGIQRYGEEHDNGQQLLAWVRQNYDFADSIGGDPLDDTQCGGVILKRKDENKR